MARGPLNFEGGARKVPKSTKLSYLGHRPRGVAKETKPGRKDPLAAPKHRGQHQSTRVLNEYTLSQKVSTTTNLEQEILREDDARRRKRVRSVRKKLLKTSLFSLNGDLDVPDEEDHIEGDQELDDGMKKAKRQALLDLLAKEGPSKDDDSTTIASSEDELDEDATRLRFESGADRKRRLDSGEPDDRKSKRSKLADLINKSKEARAEASRAKHVQMSLLNLLEEDFDSIKGELQLKPTRAEIIANPALAVEANKSEDRIFDYRTQKQIQVEDDFDSLLNSMKLSARGVASERIKTAAEIAQEKARKLRKIEEERVAKLKSLESLKETLESEEASSSSEESCSSSEERSDNEPEEDDD